jgi:hypothetical protein
MVPRSELEGPHGSKQNYGLLGYGRLLTYIGFRTTHDGSLGRVESHHFRPILDFKCEPSEMTVGSRSDYQAATINAI